MTTSIRSLQFTRRDLNDDATTETLSLVRAETLAPCPHHPGQPDPGAALEDGVRVCYACSAPLYGALYVQVKSGSPDEIGRHEGSYVGLYDLGGSQVSSTVGSFDLVPGDRLLAGEEAQRVAEQLAEEANRAAGAGLTAADYLAADGSLPFASIFGDWENGGTTVEAWDPEVAAA